MRPPYGEKLRQILPLLAGLVRRRREGVVRALLAFTYRQATPEDWARTVEVLDVMGLPSKLWEDLDRKIRAEGRAEGRAAGRAEGFRAGRRQGVLEVFEARLNVVPAAVKRAVAEEQDAERLSVWLRGIIRAIDEAEAMRVVAGAQERRPRVGSVSDLSCRNRGAILKREDCPPPSGGGRPSLRGGQAAGGSSG